jgi:hypothetical protein
VRKKSAQKVAGDITRALFRAFGATKDGRVTLIAREIPRIAVVETAADGSEISAEYPGWRASLTRDLPKAIAGRVPSDRVLCVVRLATEEGHYEAVTSATWDLKSFLPKWLDELAERLAKMNDEGAISGDDETENPSHAYRVNVWVFLTPPLNATKQRARNRKRGRGLLLDR